MSKKVNEWFSKAIVSDTIPEESPHGWTCPVGDTSKTNLSWWFPKLVAAKLPVPRTRFVSFGDCKPFAESFFDGTFHKIIDHLFSVLEAFGDEMGWPCFLRTGYFSGKHDWKKTCFVENKEALRQNVPWLAQMQEMVWLMEPDGLSTWVIRELLETEPVFHCETWGDFPVTREFRVFVSGGEVKYHNPYWPEDAVKDGGPTTENWKESLERISLLDGEEQREIYDLASAAGGAVGGNWSVDIIETKNNGWFVTDMAVAEKSFGFDPDKF